MPINGDIITSESGKEYVINALISTGTGQGDIYRATHGDAEYAVKLFHGEDEGTMTEQIRRLIRRGRACDEYVHPLDIVHVGSDFGYVMEYVNDSYKNGSVLYNGIRNGDSCEELPFHTKLSILINLCEALSHLDRANLAMIDIKFENIKVNAEDCSIKILDTDTIVRSENGECFIEGTVGFMPPLTMRGEEAPTKYNDYFALAVIIFMTLLGSHPLLGRAGDVEGIGDVETKLLAEHPVYVWNKNDSSNRPSEENYMTEEKLNRYPDFFLEAMERTFVDGLYNAEERTSPEKWKEVLERLYSLSYCCSECGEEHFLLPDAPSLCAYCGSQVVKPLALVADKTVPLFLSLSIRDSDIFSGISKPKKLFRVAETPYSGKYGLLVECGTLRLVFPGGRCVEFSRGKTAPLFMNCSYEIENRSFRLSEII